MLQTESFYPPAKHCKAVCLVESGTKVTNYTSKLPLFPLLSPDCTCDYNWEVPLSATELCGVMFQWLFTSSSEKMNVCPLFFFFFLTLLAQSVAAILLVWDSVPLLLYSKSKLQQV